MYDFQNFPGLYPGLPLAGEGKEWKRWGGRRGVRRGGGKQEMIEEGREEMERKMEEI